MKTYYGTYLDIDESDIFCIYDNYKLYFNSEYIKNKYVREVDDYVYIEECKIKGRYNFDIDLHNYFAIVFYKKIQKKGFRVELVGTKKKIENFNFKV